MDIGLSDANGFPFQLRAGNYSSGEGSARVRGSGKKQLPGPDRRRPDSYMPEEIEDYGACPGILNPET
jgi:hypothetical protein